MVEARRTSAKKRKKRKKKTRPAGRAAGPRASTPPIEPSSAPPQSPSESTATPPTAVSDAPPPAPSWLVVDRVQLTEILGINDNTISDWLKHGMPALDRGGRGKPAKYDAIACLKWYRENKVGRNALEIAKTESAREDVILKRFKAGELAQALVRTQEVVALGQHFVKGWVALIRALPKQARRAGIITTPEHEKQMAALCRRRLEEVSRWQVPAVPMQREVDTDDSANDPAA